jgi:hypothetical protein
MWLVSRICGGARSKILTIWHPSSLKKIRSISSHKTIIIPYSIMLARSILRSSRNVAVDSTTARLSSIPFSSRLSSANAVTRLRTAPNTSSVIPTAAYRQWRLYSSETASEKKAEATEEVKAENGESSEVEKLKKDLEAKEKELAVMKVSYIANISCFVTNRVCNRITTYAQSPTTETSKSEQSGKHKVPATLRYHR